MQDSEKPMADDVPDRDSTVVLNLEDPSITSSYANVTHILVNSTDILMYFGVRSDGISNDHVKFSQKIAVSHASFVAMMEYWAPRYTFLQTVYGDKPKSLNDIDQSVVKRAFEEMLGLPASFAKEAGDQ